MLEVDDVLLQRLDLNLRILKLLEQLQTNLVALINLLLHLQDVIIIAFDLVLQFLLLLKRRLKITSQLSDFILEHLILFFLLYSGSFVFFSVSFLFFNLFFLQLPMFF